MKKILRILLGGLFLAYSCNKDEPKKTEKVQIEKPIEKSYIVTFDSKGGSPINSTTVASGETIREPSENPSKKDYNFGGWYRTNGTNGTQFSFNSTIIKSNITLYAKWELKPNILIVTFDSKGGSPINSTTVASGETISEPLENPSKNDYNFGGWYRTNGTNGTQFAFNSTIIKSNITLYAKWELKPNILIVTFESQGGSEVPSKTVGFNETIGKPNDPNMVNSATFEGWYREQEYSNKFEFNNDKITDNITLYAKWVIDSGVSADDNITYGTIYYGGKVWLDRNLGATRLPSNVTDTGTQACGNYYQWGRGNDGHEKYNSTVSDVKINWNSTNNDTFIKLNDEPLIWIKGIEGISDNKTYNTMNNPCPDGFRVPTKQELGGLHSAINQQGEVTSNYHKAYFHALKMVRCGYRSRENGSFESSRGQYGSYWLDDRQSNTDAYKLMFGNNFGDESSQGASYGQSVRCIKN